MFQSMLLLLASGSFREANRAAGATALSLLPSYPSASAMGAEADGRFRKWQTKTGHEMTLTAFSEAFSQSGCSCRLKKVEYKGLMAFSKSIQYTSNGHGTPDSISG